MKKIKDIVRCHWVNMKNPLYISYHDCEWGVPVHDDRHLFEMLILEGAQAGLSWETVLNKREEYRKVFHNFDVKKCAKLTETFLNKQLLNPNLIRNRLKIHSIPINAKAFLEIQKEYGSFDKYLWGYVKNKPVINNFKESSGYPTRTDLSDAISLDLKKRGFKFVGTTIIYAYLQAVGVVNDHSPNCYLKKKGKE